MFLQKLIVSHYYTVVSLVNQREFKMKYRKFNKYEAKIEKVKRLEEAMHGEGLYLYENNSDATLTLPRPTKSGLREVGPRGQFQGDNYYMQMMRRGEVRLIKTLQAPQPVVEQQEPKEQIMNEEKLILDQPDTVTEKGKVEHVVDGQTPVQKLQEQGGDEQPDVLLNEGPVDDGFVIVGD
jgi:hypothetical protein